MLSDWLQADDIIAMIDDMAADAKHPAFAHRGHTHLYSGPDEEVSKQIAGVFRDNHDRAIVRAARLGAVLIDNTRVGKFLEEFKGVGSATTSGKGVWDYFRDNPLIDPIERVEQARRLWKHASHLFALASCGHVTTTVCGAYRGSVYYTVEVPYTINPLHADLPGLAISDTIKALFVPRKQPIEFVNMLAFDRVEDGYTPTKWENAHRLICRAEQRMALNEALDGVKPKTIRKAFANTADEVLLRPIEAYEYFLESREAYIVDRARMLKATTAKLRKSVLEPPVVRQDKRERSLQEFALMAVSLVKMELELLPPGKRPSIPAFTINGGKTEIKL